MAGLLLWIVQSLGVTALASLASRLGARRVRPSVQHVVWLCTLACIAGLAWAGLVPQDTPIAADGTAVQASAPSALAPLAIPAAPDWLSFVMFAVWITGTVWLGTRVCWQLGRIRRLKQSCVVMAGRALHRHSVLLAASRRGRRARFCWCEEAAGPVMLGFGRAMIAVPRQLANELDDADLERVLLHELAHVRRRDDWSALAEQLLLALMWINPAVQWAMRGLAVSREMACDDWVIRRTVAPVAYARCLTAVAAFRVHGGGRLSPAIVGSRRVLRRRVARAIDARTRPSARMSQVAYALAPVLTGLVGVAILALPPIVVEERGSVEVPGGARFAVSVPGLRLAATPVPQPVASNARAATTASGRSAIAHPRRVEPEGRRGSVQPEDPMRLMGEAALSQTPPDAAGQPIVGETISDPGGTEPALLLPSEARAIGDVLMAPNPGGQDNLVTTESHESAWWSKASGAAGMIGSGAASAGRATASFAKLVGGALSSPFAR